MIWAALFIGLTVLLAVRTARPQGGAFAPGSPRQWLVLPDEPSLVPVLDLPQAIPGRAGLPAVAVTYANWSAPSQAWRAEKPLTPWFRHLAPYVVVAAFGATSVDLTALGLGVPEIVATQPAAPESSAAGRGFEHFTDGDLAALFGSAHDTTFGGDSFAWDAPAPLTPAWQISPEPSHDWWA
jgi:hypothetical protein